MQEIKDLNSLNKQKTDIVALFRNFIFKLRSSPNKQNFGTEYRKALYSVDPKDTEHLRDMILQHMQVTHQKAQMYIYI